MPNVRKLSDDEVRAIENKGKGQRKLIEEQYDSILNEYMPGEYGEATLELSENRLTVRNRLKAAARRRNLMIDFRRTKEDLLRFQVIDPSAAPAGSEAEPAAPKKGGRKKKNA